MIVVGVHCVHPSFPNGYIIGDENPMVGSVIEFKYAACSTSLVVSYNVVVSMKENDINKSLNCGRACRLNALTPASST